MTSGGYRPPSKPAMVSGPGSMSKRTDGGPADKQPMRALPNPGYGEAKEFAEIQAGAPMMAQQTAESVNMALPPNIMAPTERPEEPPTSGIPFGPGVDSLPTYDTRASEDLQGIKTYLPDLEVALKFRNVPESFRTLVDYIRNS